MRALETALRVQAARNNVTRLKPRKWPRPRFPTNERLYYYKHLLYVIETVQYLVQRDLLPVLPAILGAHAATRPEARSDADQPRVPAGSSHGGEFASKGGAGAAAKAARKTRAAAKKAELLAQGNAKRAAALGPAAGSYDPAHEGMHAELAGSLARDRAALADTPTIASPFRSSGVPGAGPLEVHVAPKLRTEVEHAIGQQPRELGKHGELSGVDVALQTAAPHHAAPAGQWVDGWIGESSVPSANHAFTELSTPGSWAQAQYAATQASIQHHLPALQAKGIVDAEGYVTLYRGVRHEQAHQLRSEAAGSGGEAVVRLRKTSSWTESHAVASEDFAGPDGEVMVQRVHHTRAFATWRTQGKSDIGLNEQREWVVIADADVMHVRLAKRGGS